MSKKAVDDAIRHNEWKEEYMTLTMKLNEEREEGRAEGVVGIIRILKNMNSPDVRIIDELKKTFQVDDKQAMEWLKTYA